MNKALIEKVLHYFATHKNSSECFATQDNMIFHRSADAYSHASSRFKNHKVEEFKREDIAKLEAELKKNCKTGDEGGKGYGDMTKEVLQGLCTEREIEFKTSENKAALIAKLEEADEAAAQ